MATRNRLRLLLVVSLLGLALPASAQKYVCMELNVGAFCMELHPGSAPVTVANFLQYVNDGDYTESLIHRSEPNFVIQGGGYYGGESNLGLQVPTDPTIKNEFSRSNTRGTVAMAKLGNDSNSADSEWFINLADNRDLDSTNGGYTVFATVVKGMDVVDKIAGLPRVDLTGDLGSAFYAVPVNLPTASALIGLEDLVLVNRVYATDSLSPVPPYQCTASSPADTLTEFCGTYLTFPVDVNGQLFDATLNLASSTTTLVFNVDKSRSGRLSTLARSVRATTHRPVS